MTGRVAAAAPAEVQEGGKPRGCCSTLFYNSVSCFVAHLPLWPSMALGVDILITNYIDNGWTLIVASHVLYFLWSYVYHRRATTTGEMRLPWLPAYFVPCHDYFPIKTLLWDGAKYSSTPNAGHDTTYAIGQTDRTCIYSMHPHGPIPLGGAVFGPQLSRWPAIASRLVVAVADVVFLFPLIREFYLIFGSISVSRDSIMSSLRRGNSVMLLPGGIQEQILITKPGEDELVLNKRKGFVKIALETGSSLVPVYVFNERKVYKSQSTLTAVVSSILKRICGIGVPCVRGRYFTLMPYAVPVTIVVGKPLAVSVNSEPTAAEIDDLHARYVTALTQLYDEHKNACGHKDIALVIK